MGANREKETNLSGKAVVELQTNHAYPVVTLTRNS